MSPSASTPDSRRRGVGRSPVWVNSLHRSLMEGPLEVTRAALPGMVVTWWGAHLQVNQGDPVYYFGGPAGLAVEWAGPQEDSCR